MKKRLISTLLSLALVLVMLPVTARAVTVVETIEIKNLVAPVDGNTIFPGANAGNSAYKIYEVEWFNVTDSCFMSVGDKFEAGKVYRAQVWVEANSGYEFKYKDSQTPNVSASIDGTSAPVTKAYEYSPWAMVVVTRTFEPCPKKEISHVDIVIDPVVEGGYVPFSIGSASANVIIDPDQHTRYYPSGFCWSNMTYDDPVFKGAKFKGGQEYYVDIALKPLYSSYRFTESFTATINGKDAKVTRFSDNSVVIGYRFTCYGTITGGDLNPTATLPKAGNIPDFSVTYAYPQCDHIQYAERPIWTEVATGKKMTSEDTFKAGMKYHFSVTLMADYGYVFERDENGKMRHTPMITGDKVDTYTYGRNDYYARETITLEKIFTAPGTPAHTPSAWRTTGAYHYKACTTCGEFLEQEDHKGGTATCTEQAKCSVCGVAYGPEPEDHTWSPKYHSVGASGHAYICARCKAPEKVLAHNPGAAATETTPQTCKDCGYIITPANNHTHALTQVSQVPATCTTDGVAEHFTCSGCTDLFADSSATKKRTREELTIAATGHSFDSGVCTACGYAQDTDVTTPTEILPTAPENPGNPGGSGKTEPSDNTLLIVLLGIGVFGAALAVTLVILKCKKKPTSDKGE